MKEFFDVLQNNEVLITRENGKWKVFHVSDVSEKGDFICEIVKELWSNHVDLNIRQNQLIREGRLTDLYFPPLIGLHNVLARNFAERVQIRKDRNLDVTMYMSVWTPNDKGRLYCVLTPLNIIYNQDQMPKEISKIIGTIKLYNWKRFTVERVD